MSLRQNTKPRNDRPSRFRRIINRLRQKERQQHGKVVITEPSDSSLQGDDRAERPSLVEAKNVSIGFVSSIDSEDGPKSLWDLAYDALREEKPKVVEAYEVLLFNTLPYLKIASSTIDLENSLSESRPDPANPTRTPETSRRKMMEDIVEFGQRHMDEKRIYFDIGHQRFVLRDQMQYVVAGVQAAKSRVNEAVKASPLANTAWAGICLFLPLLTNPSDVQAANEEGLAYVAHKIQYYTAIESHFLSEQDDEALRQLFEGRLVKLYSAIIDFQAQIVLRFFRGRFKNLLRDTAKWDSWESMLKNVKDLGENLEKESLHTNTTLMREELGRLAKWAEKTDEYLCVKSFRRGDYAWYKDRVEDRVPDTCLWFLNHDSYQSWLEADSGPLLVSADPGCGKSVLAKYLIGSSFGFKVPKDAAICYFFFKEGDQNTIALAFCALIHQLLCLRPQLIHHALSRYKHDGDELANNVTALWDIIQSAVEDPEAGAIIIVLDALDECLQDKRNMATLSRYIRGHFEQGPRKLKILMTSRPYQSTVQHIQELEESFPNIRIKGEDESDMIREEINSVIEYRVSRMKKFNDDLKMHLKRRLLDITHRTYLWLYLVFDYLESPTIKNTARGLDRAIQDLPVTVSDAYENLLSRSPQQEETRKVVLILLAAYRPLTLAEMQVALDITLKTTSLEDFDPEPDERFKIRLRELCGLFVTVHDKRVYFLHQTAREFLLSSSVSPPSPTTSAGWAHKFSISQAHAVLAESCTVYMDLLNPLADIDKYSGFLDYSAQNWCTHFREAGNFDDAEIVPFALRLCDAKSKSYSMWSRIEQHRYSIDRHQTSLAIASYLGHEAVVKLLLASEIDVNLADYDRKTPLSYAAKEGHGAVVNLLLNTSKINVNLADYEGRTPLSYAAEEGHEVVVKLLLDATNIDVNLADENGLTPLALASRRGRKSIVKLLLNASNIDINYGDCWGRTSLDVASLNGHEGIVKMLSGAIT